MTTRSAASARAAWTVSGERFAAPRGDGRRAHFGRLAVGLLGLIWVCGLLALMG